LYLTDEKLKFFVFICIYSNLRISSVVRGKMSSSSSSLIQQQQQQDTVSSRRKLPWRTEPIQKQIDLSDFKRAAYSTNYNYTYHISPCKKVVSRILETINPTKGEHELYIRKHEMITFNEFHTLSVLRILSPSLKVSFHVDDIDADNIDYNNALYLMKLKWTPSDFVIPASSKPINTENAYSVYKEWSKECDGVGFFIPNKRARYY